MPHRKKLGALVRGSSVRRSSLKQHRELLDGLAHRVFTPALDRSQTLLAYVQSSTDDVSRYRDAFLDEDAGQEAACGDTERPLDREPQGAIAGQDAMGPFETSMLGKLSLGEKNLIALVGDIGCGKSLVVEYLLRGPIDREDHCKPVCGAKGTRLAIRFDFVHDMRLAELAKDGHRRAEIRSELMEEICERMRSGLDDACGIEEPEELVTFWDQQFVRLRGAFYDSSVFVRLRNSLKVYVRDHGGNAADPAVRRSVMREVIVTPQLRFEYYARLWRYALDAKHKGKHQCQLLVFDNVDALDSSVQSSLLTALLSLAEISGCTVLLLLRPETLAKRHKNTRVMDMMSHSGATPSQVVIDRLRRFIDAPVTFYRSEERIPLDEYNRIVGFAARLYRSMRSSPHHVACRFIEALSGYDTRNALIFAQEIIKIDPEVRDDVAASDERVVREFLRGGGPFYSLEQQPFVDNLFCTLDEVGWSRPLIKPRILQLVVASPKHRTTIDRILQVMAGGFEYTEDEIAAALNDLLDPRRQLLRSNGSDSYKRSELAEDGNDVVMATAMGLGYAETLCSDLDYVQEVMYDTVVDQEHFGAPLLDQTVQDRLRLVGGFLRLLLTIDKQETAKFLQLSNVIEYRDCFPGGLLTRPMMTNAVDSVRAITSAIEAHRADEQAATADALALLKNEMDNIRKVFQDLKQDAEQLDERLRD